MTHTTTVVAAGIANRGAGIPLYTATCSCGAWSQPTPARLEHTTAACDKHKAG